MSTYYRHSDEVMGRYQKHMDFVADYCNATGIFSVNQEYRVTKESPVTRATLANGVVLDISANGIKIV